MKKNQTIQYYILRKILFLFSLLLHIIPTDYLSRWISKRIYKSRQKLADENITKAFDGKLSPKKVEQIRIQSLQSQLMTGLGCIKQFSIKKKIKIIKKEHRGHWPNKIDWNKGVIILSLHIGHWMELSPSGLSEYISEDPISILVRVGRTNSLYHRLMMDVLSRDRKVRVCSKSLDGIKLFLENYNKYKKALFFIDQSIKGSKKAMPIEVLGRVAYLDTLPFIMAKQSPSIIIPVVCVKTKYNEPYQGKLIYGSVIENPIEKSTEEMLKETASFMSQIIQEYPEQWLWIHNFWK